MGFFDMIFDKVAKVIGDEAGRQNTIARFGAGIEIALDGTVTDPRDPTKRIHHDEFSKLPVGDKMKSIAPSVERLMETPQIRPEHINAQTAASLLMSSFKSDDQIGKQMRVNTAASVDGVDGRMEDIINGPMFKTLKRNNEAVDSTPKLKM